MDSIYKGKIQGFHLFTEVQQLKEKDVTSTGNQPAKLSYFSRFPF